MDGVEKELNKFLETKFKGCFFYSGNGIMWYNTRVDDIVVRFNPDFCGMNEADNKNIELFGDYWHSKKITGNNKVDEERQRLMLYEAVNRQCLIIWEHELRNKEELYIKIKDFMSCIEK